MHGGKRAGAGRKKGFAAKSAEEARRVLSEMVMREIEPIGKALIAKAKKGDVIATRELFDRAFGKASQTTKIDLNDERNPVPIIQITDETSSRYLKGNKLIYGGLSVPSRE